MNPSNKEMQLCRNCQLYAYVLESQGKEIPEEIQDCIDSYDYVINCASELAKEIKGLDSDAFERIVKNPQLQKARELDYWWEMQQEADRLHGTLGITCI